MSDPKPKNNELIASLDQIHLSLQGKTILHDVSLELQAGKILTVIGPNGAGKSSLIQVLLGLEKPDSGSVYRKPKLRIGYVPQKISINTIMPITVERFVALAGKRQWVQRFIGITRFAFGHAKNKSGDLFKSTHLL